MTSAIAESTSGLIAEYCALRSSKGMFTGAKGSWEGEVLAEPCFLSVRMVEGLGCVLQLPTILFSEHGIHAASTFALQEGLDVTYPLPFCGCLGSGCILPFASFLC